MSGFTPGPWETGGISMSSGSISVVHRDYRIVICDVTNAASLGDFVNAAIRGRRDFGSPDTAKTQWANARLIAAAPDLLAALQAHDAYMKLWFSGPDSDALHPAAAANWRTIRAAIARAEGKD